ncbi:MAG: hypothetical protein AB8B72_10180 [Crocinitomicaceae bacterium]
MNFDNLKEALDADAKVDSKTELKVDLGKGKNNPVSAIRSNMRSEIITQLIGVIIFLAAPFTFIKLDDKPEAIYLIFMFITCVMIMVYTVRLSLFLKEVDPMTKSTRGAIQLFMYKSKMTLQVYKSFVLASTLLLPATVFALLTGNANGELYNPDIFEKWLFLNISSTELILLILGYLVLAAIFYYMTIGWTKLMYGKHLLALEKILETLDEEE